MKSVTLPNVKLNATPNNGLIANTTLKKQVIWLNKECKLS